MRKPIALNTADWHMDRVDRGAWRRRPEISGDSCCSLGQMVDYAIKYGVPMLAAGDLFDVAPQDDSSALRFCIEQMDRMEAADLSVYFNQGQHDYLYSAPWLSLGKAAKHVNHTNFNVGSLKAYAFDYTRPEHLADAWKKVPRGIDLLMTHQVWVDLMGKHIGGECNFAEVPYASILLTGDFHQHKIVRAKNAQGKSLTVMSPGSACMRSIDEMPDKAVFLLYDDRTIESLPLKTRKVYRFTADSKAGLKEVLAKLAEVPVPTPGLPAAIATPIVHVTYDAEIADAYRKLQIACQDRLHLFAAHAAFDVYAGTSLPVAAAVPSAAAVAQGVDKAMRSVFAKDSTEYAVASCLLGARPAEELDQLESQFLARP